MYIMVDWDDVVLGPRNVCASIAVNVGYCHRFRRLMGRGLIATNHHTHTHILLAACARTHYQRVN